MKRLTLTLLTLAALAASTPAAASADTLLAPAPGAVNLATGGGYLAWFSPGEDTGWNLVVRNPDGTVVQPDVPFFPGPTQLSIGSGIDEDFNRTLSITYARSDGDLYTFDVRAGTERKLTRLSTKAYREDAPQIVFGSYAFVRRGGKRPGVYVSASGRAPRRLTADTPADLAFNGTRVAYAKGNAVLVRRVSGEGRTLTFRAGSRPSSPVLTRYRVAWLERATGTVRQTPRFAGSGGPYDVRTSQAGARTIPGAQSIVMDRSSQANTFLDGAGLKQAVPPLF